MARDYADFIDGTLVTQLATGTTTGVTVQLKKVNDAYPTWPTGQHEIRIRRDTEDGRLIERVGVAAGTTTNTTTGIATLGTLTRNLSLTDGTDVTGTSATITWPSSTQVYIPWGVGDAEVTAKLNDAQTFSALQTFSAGTVVTGTSSYVKVPSLTTTQRNALSASNGMIIYNSTTGQFNKYEGGAWSTDGSTTIADGSVTVAGKFEEATVAEQAAATATGGTGARLVPSAANMITTSAGAGDAGKIVVLPTAGVFDVATGGSGRATATAYAPICGGTTAGGAHQSIASVGTAKQVLTSNGAGALPSMQDPTTTSKVVYLGYADNAAVGASSTDAVALPTHNVLVPGGTLIAGVGYEVEASGSMTWGAGTLNLGIGFGTTVVTSPGLTPSGTASWHIKGTIYGTAAAGASVAVRGGCAWADHSTNKVGANYGTANFATNGDLTLNLIAQYGTSNGTNGITCKTMTIKKISTTLF